VTTSRHVTRDLAATGCYLYPGVSTLLFPQQQEPDNVPATTHPTPRTVQPAPIAVFTGTPSAELARTSSHSGSNSAFAGAQFGKRFCGNPAHHILPPPPRLSKNSSPKPLLSPKLALLVPFWVPFWAPFLVPIWCV
jgi:hypothetical protein